VERGIWVFACAGGLAGRAETGVPRFARDDSFRDGKLSVLGWEAVSSGMGSCQLSDKTVGFPFIQKLPKLNYFPNLIIKDQQDNLRGKPFSL
jgi:hypothetical protein